MRIEHFALSSRFCLGSELCGGSPRPQRLATRLASPGTEAEVVAAGSVGVMSSPVSARFTAF